MIPISDSFTITLIWFCLIAKKDKKKKKKGKGKATAEEEEDLDALLAEFGGKKTEPAAESTETAAAPADEVSHYSVVN